MGEAGCGRSGLWEKWVVGEAWGSSERWGEEWPVGAYVSLLLASGAADGIAAEATSRG